jgi:ubiquinone/menaquinone biosynthesis C-methylase UbiE
VSEEEAVLRQSFGSIADGYDRFRPAPPDEAVQWAVGSPAVDVLEIGAGTGALTRRLVSRHAHVRAVEPDERMRAVLRDRVEGVEVFAGHAEQIPADDASFDAVIGASMWHWVDEPRALPEVARVLRRGGSFSLLWNGIDRSVGWARSLWAGGRELGVGEVDQVDSRRRARHEVHLRAHDPFVEPERRVLRWTCLMAKEDLVGMAGTYSAVITMPEAERDEYLASMSRFLETHDVPVSEGLVEVPMRCICWRTTRR